MPRKNIITSIIIGTTFILAGVGIFTALRLYQLRDQAVAPNAPQSKLFAWDCSKYTFNVTQTGDVSVENSSDRTEPAQMADVLIDGAKVASLEVPDFGPRAPKTQLGKVDVPLSGNFTWKVVGSLDCQNEGSYSNQTACAGLQTTPDSGNWNLTPSFTTKNTTNQPITVQWTLDCESRQENIGRAAMSSCKNTTGETTLQPNETLQKGLGAVCLTWQLDYTCNGKDTGFVVEPQNCTVQTSSPTPTASATPTASPTSTPTVTSTPLPNLCALNFSIGTSTSTPTGTPTATPTATPQVACNTPCSTDATCKAIDSSYTCYPPTSTCRLAAFPDRQECNIPQTTSPTPHNSFECNSVCSSNAECLTIGSNYTCANIGANEKRCRITTNTTSATCQTGGTGTSTPSTRTSTPAPTTTPVTLPEAGIGFPTIGLIIGGMLLTIIAIVVAL